MGTGASTESHPPKPNSASRFDAASASASASEKDRMSASAPRRPKPPGEGRPRPAGRGRPSRPSPAGGDERREEGDAIPESSSSGSRKRVPAGPEARADRDRAAGRRKGPLVAGGARGPAASPAPVAARARARADPPSSSDLPMADLMAYLQIVADSSSNLPLTRRDDPELGRTVSSLTAEEYETKCRAFVPADVRIFGGVFGRYGRVWDLPTSEEFDVVSSTREPGLSHGGAVCNALLKAMYDTESEASNLDRNGNNPTSPSGIDPKNLFDDDDDETVDTAGFTVDRTIASFDTLLLNDNQQSALSWVELLRKMNKEMQGLGYNQSAAVTTSYKLDLTGPFTLISPDFKQGINKKRALLIGCNYRRTPDAGLKASHDDVRSVKDFLVNVYGFPETPDHMTVLMDDPAHEHPTLANVAEAFKKLAQESQPGDAVFVLFSGHGARILDSPVDSEAESYDEALLPCDYDESGMIRDTLVFKTLLAPMRKGVTVTCIFDCCHTGVMVDLPYLWTTKGDKGEAAPKMSLNNDFSFVRFLKVVKTLYESSVFTKLGKGIGSELSKQQPARDDETATETTGSLVTMPENEAAPKPGNHQSLFTLLTCQSPKDLASKVINCTLHAPADSDDETLPRNNTMEDAEFDDRTHDTYSTATSGEGR